ncbi:MAG: type II and III secretion system protein, partial [Sedimentisphaerales bacterium]|nr:type II and III secretion system protein [Sedimentisphaerales bacterium]
LVSEKFLEDIGFDVDFTLTNLGGKWDPIQVNQNNLVDTGDTPAMQINGAYGGILDDLQVAFIIKATQQSSNSRSLQAPRVTVLSGESATFRVTTDASYVSNVTSDQSTSSNGSDNSNVATTTQTDISTVTSGVILNITPTISSDRKYVLLRILTSATSADITSDSTKYSYTPVGGSDGTGLVTITVPSVTTTEVQTRVSVPDKGTLLMGGQKITDETQQESGVPILGKLPIIGRLFSNRNEQREQKVLLILVTPTVILQEEREREAFPDLNAA